MNLGEGFPYPQQDGGFWTTGTPQEPVLWGSNPNTMETISTNFPQVIGSSIPIATSMQENNHTDNKSWEGLVGIYSDFLQQTTKYAVQSSPAVQPQRSLLYPTSKIPNARSYSPTENNWTEHQSVSHGILHPSTNVMLMHTSGESQSTHKQMSDYTFPVPYHLSCFATAPCTPDQGRLSKKQWLPVAHNASADGILDQEKEQQGITSSNGQEMRTHSNQLLESVMASSSPSSFTSRMEENFCEGGVYGRIDLNKAPKLNTPKRKKHRPKVVVEGKPKRTPRSNPSHTENKTSSGKRKYVRKNGPGESISQHDNEIKTVEASPVQSAERSCRRMLNFEKEAEVQGNDQWTTSSMGLNRRDAEQEQQMRCRAEAQQGGSTCAVLNSINHKSTQMFLPPSTTAPPITSRDETLNVMARTINLKNSMTHQTQNQLDYSKVHQQIHGKVMGQMHLHPNAAWIKLDEEKSLMLPTRIESVNNVAESNEKRGHERGCCSISELTPSQTNLMHLQIDRKPLNESGKSGMGNLEIHRKRKYEDKLYGASSIMTYCNTTVKQSSRQVQYRGSNGVYKSNAPYNNGSLRSSDFEKNWPQEQTNSASGFPNYPYKDPTVDRNNIQGQRYSSEVKLQRNCMEGQLFKEESHRPSLLTAIAQQNMSSPLQRIPITTQANETRTPEIHTPVKKQMVEHKSSITLLNKETKLPKDVKKEAGKLLLSKKTTEASPVFGAWKNEKGDHAMKIEEVTCQLRQLQISHSGQARVREKETALVLYKGDETFVPCEVDPIRRRKPRLKVDLDPNTKKLWLVEKHGSESTETMRKDDEYWKKERDVFHGRVSSFISLLNLFQGDRHFSSWKCSVVDSVIGVFLTQNVADHLSSSAFMSLAAEFPPPRTVNLAREWEEPEGQIIDPDGTITYHGRTLRWSLYNHNTGTSSQPSEKRSVHVINEAGIHLIKDNYRATHGEGFSSQISSESSVFQANGGIQSSSDSEVDGQMTLCSAIMCHSLKNTRQTGSATSIQQHRSREMRSPSLDNRPPPECQKQPSPVGSRQNSTSSNIGNDVYGYLVNSKIILSEGSFAQRQNGFMCPSLGPSGNETTETPKSRKTKLNEKTESFDWDSMRKQALLKAGKQRRCKGRMDLLNYEALRQADVNRIAGIIKERGMNNMLAKRIKDFLNRLVRDHGSVDLEWLRDIPPDKAREYLLSIQGLGLKSVECVRLLTLHHIAFPVDTNVGRIAVRLGWVPLQPLPDPLSFHQLELYPTLESVQKYLWPRLCKLDHKTLYELHYHMITFGKVFCTKLLPNCKACPMKKECRHFANASASTRPALPGPEERSIVSSTTPMPPNGSSPVILKPVPLSPPETNTVSGSQYISSQQAPIVIVELPETASDIEDIVYQDTDDIPNTDFYLEELDMIELDLTKDRNEGLPEAALSQALVVLNPQDASIPAPKLKNENRLRTEHQVYEIPDSHPILEGMDKRDPDDINPYLLAIWMPGETENSPQPPKSICSFQGMGRLCNDETCFQCNSIRETNSQIVRGTILIPCRTATKGGFPLNGTYFQVNEVFADHESSHNPINVPRDWLWKLERRTVYFGTSVSTIFRGFSITEVQHCFLKGFVCVRAFERKTQSPKPLACRLHCPPSKKLNNKNEDKRNKDDTAKTNTKLKK